LLYSFGDFSLDTDRRELRGPTGLISLEPQVFDLLAYLIRSRDRVVSKDDILAAVWDGRIVSDSALTTRINAARGAIGDSGEAQRFIKTLPRKGMRFVGTVRECTGAAIVHPAAPPEPQRLLSLPDRPSIAVLPFVNMSHDPEQEYFADGTVEEIITALSRFHHLFVIARNSSFTYKNCVVDIKQVGRDLGVRYVLEGSVRKAANRVRITGQLIDAATGTHLWADRFDGELKDIFDLQDDVATRVVRAIAPKMEQAEVARAKRKPTESLDAYDCFLRGTENLHRQTPEGVDEALRLLKQAIALDPDYAAAHGTAAYCHAMRKSSGWVIHREHIEETSRFGRAAVELGKDDAVALSRAGHAIAYVVGDLDAGARLIDRALELNPNLALAWFHSGWLKVWFGDPETAIRHFADFRRMSPVGPLMIRTNSGIAFAHVLAGRYDEASSHAEQALSENPDSHQALRMAALSHALAGRMEMAERAMERLRQIDPALRVSNLRDLTPLRRPEHVARYAEGMRKAGLPE
jgi:TolB-like protein/tetratricopeptide (TPR) repeat protein